MQSNGPGRVSQGNKVQLVEVKETRGGRPRAQSAAFAAQQRPVQAANRPDKGQVPPDSLAVPPRQPTPPPRPVPKRPGSEAQQRVEAGVCDGRMWHEGCHREQPPLPALPATFRDAGHYVDCMEPWLIEEARSSALSSFEAAYEAKKGCAATVTRLRHGAEGWTTVWLAPIAMEPGLLRQLRDGNMVVLELMPQQLQPQQEAQQQQGHQGHQQQRQRQQQPRPQRAPYHHQGWQEQEEHSRPLKRARLDAGQGSTSGPPGASSSQQQQQRPRSPTPTTPSNSDGSRTRITAILRQSAWQLDDELQVEVRPACSFHSPEAATQAPCAGAMAQLAEAGSRWWWLTPVGSLVSAVREVETLRRMVSMPLAVPLLQPDRHMAVPLERLKNIWPEELAAKDGFIRFLRARYDKPQLEAIELAATHMAGLDPFFAALIKRQEQEQQQQRQGASSGGARERSASGTGADGGAASGSTSSGAPARLPVTLIQGPPGTGKTHTVIGILNTWHLTQYQRCYGSLHARLRFLSTADLLGGLAHLPGLAPRPRILVCAHSNAAVDELLERLLAGGFCDASGGTYRPSVVRVGAEDALSDNVRLVWVEHLAARLMGLGLPEWKAERYGKASRVGQLRLQVGQLKAALDEDPANPEQLVLNLARAVVDHERAALELSRLDAVERLIASRSRGDNQRAATAAEREVRDWLELSFVEEAEMVFVTLSSSARRVFDKAQRQFEHVLIDEAAQAAEVSGLQPLVYGAIGVVLVGDPQQLPATVFSAAAREAQMERSLFERLQQAGVPVKMLNVQYRMHPQIREFPSKHFYNSQLVDAPSVTNRPAPLWYSCNCLTPYVVFDVSGGVERHVNRSACNSEEAHLVVALFWELRTFLQQAVAKWQAGQGPKPEGVKVGVITPYRSQRQLIKDTLAAKLGPGIASEVRVETVDSFQGKQMDVIILSLVRASARASRASSGGVGFLADTRRMNVAITRAKQALWVVGNLRTLRTDATWSALIGDATARGMVLEECSAQALYPEHRYPGSAAVLQRR